MNKYKKSVRVQFYIRSLALVFATLCTGGNIAYGKLVFSEDFSGKNKSVFYNKVVKNSKAKIKNGYAELTLKPALKVRAFLWGGGIKL